MTELKKKFTTETLLEQIPLDKCWKIAAKILLNFALLRGSKTVVPLLGRGDGFFTPIWGWEKYKEIVIGVYGEANKNLVVKVNELFNIPVEDAIGAENLLTVVGTLQCGPDRESSYIERTPERVIMRFLKCPWWEIYMEYGIKPEFTLCEPCCAEKFEEGIQKINPKITYKLSKAMPRGDPYCEFLTEFKEV